MIRKLAGGRWRLYSRKKNPRTGKRRNLGTFTTKKARRSTSARCSISRGIEKAVMAGLVPAIHDLMQEKRGCPAQGRA